MKNKMEVKNVFKKNFIAILFISFFMVGYSYAQEKIYFFIDKSDTLTKKQFNSTTKNYTSYLLIDEKRIRELNRTPLVKGKVWVPESDDDFHTLGPSFWFSIKNDQIITEDEFLKLDIIERKELLRKISSSDPSSFSYFFIEPKECNNKYILREVFPVIFE